MNKEQVKKNKDKKRIYIKPECIQEYYQYNCINQSCNVIMVDCCESTFECPECGQKYEKD